MLNFNYCRVVFLTILIKISTVSMHLTAQNIHTITDCVQVTSDEGIFVFRKSLKRTGLSKIIESFSENSEQVCGLYLMTDPDKVIEVDVKFTDLDCEMENLAAFFDGFEMNGEYFPNPLDSKLDGRFFEFCDEGKNHNFDNRKKFRKRKFISHQNAAVFQYKIPYHGSFVIEVKHKKISEPCNILAEGAQYFALQNHGFARNCTLTTLYPAVVTILKMEVGGATGGNFINYDCNDAMNKDKIILGGSNGLDTSTLQGTLSICGSGAPEQIEHVVLCAITSVRLESSGKNNNKVIVSLREADENDLEKATAVCEM